MRIIQYLCRKTGSLGSDDSGFVVLCSLALFLFLFVICGSVYAVGDTIYQKMRLQNACDEAAYSAAVVEADGLSRMAVVNKALAWNYIQMCNKQMDYITYKWLKLTLKRYNEDRANAKEFHWRTVRVLNVGKSGIGCLWWIPFLKSLMSGSPFQGFGCKHWQHDEPGKGWWCGLGMDSQSVDRILLNKRERITLSDLEKIDDNFPDDNLRTLGESIDNDKTTIETLNAMQGVIARNMQKSMDDTAQFVLTKLLSGNALDAYRQEDFFIRITVPQCVDPYQTEGASVNSQNVFLSQTIFAPAYNTESYERMLLDSISSDRAGKNLIEHFNSSGGAACGLDQWFVRGEGVYSDDKDHAPDAPAANAHLLSSPSHGKLKSSSEVLWSSRRSEGAPGIQRVYKDANINETGSGILGLKAINRGNHVLHLLGDSDSIRDSADMSSLPSNDDLGNLFSCIGDGGLSAFLGYEALLDVIIPIIKKMVSQCIREMIQKVTVQANSFLDIMPSAVNQPSNNSAMCKNAAASIALVSEYRWASAKWFINTHYDWWTYWGWYHWRPSIRLPFRAGAIAAVIADGSCLEWFASSDGRHYHWPKWYCGTPYQFLFFRNIPPLEQESTGGHGYLKTTWDIGNLLAPFNEHTREGYCSCAVTPDGKFSTSSDTPPAALRGHVRIYGDDWEIWDNRYIGSKIKPWFINDTYFSGGGTIIVAAGRRQRNPFVIFFNKAGANDTVMKRKNIFYPFDPGRSGNRIWAFSAARAGVKRTRLQGKDKNKRLYQVVYDDAFDPKNHKFNDGAYYFSKDNKEPQKYVKDSAIWKSKTLREQIISGCNCGTDLSGMWNLCETDWDATLLPLSHAAAAASTSVAAAERLKGTNWKWGGNGKNLLSPQPGEWIRFISGSSEMKDAQEISKDELESEMKTKFSTSEKDKEVNISDFMSGKVL